MLFQDLPELGSTPIDKTQILVGQDGILKRTSNLFTESLDLEIVRLVLSKLSPNDLLNQHISDQTIHTRQDDTTVSPTTTWSSARVNSAIQGSSPWFNLDSIPEGSTNKYWTDDRAKQVINATTQGVPVVDHQQIASKIISTLLGFNSRTFRYVALRDQYSPTTPASVSIDNGPYTDDYFDVTPGIHNVRFGGANPYGGGQWICEELAHVIPSLGSGNVQITPKLTLDAFSEGSVNRFWNNTNFANSGLVSSINNHLNVPAEFTAAHARIADNTSAGGTQYTWSATKITNYISSEIAKNRALLVANTKSVCVGHETAGSGFSSTAYTYSSTQVGSVYTHYVIRNPNSSAFNNAPGASLSGQISLPLGSWLIYWEADATLRTGVFANATVPQTYVALSTTPQTPLLTVPGVLVNTTTSNIIYYLVTKFSSTTPFSSSLASTWLQPRSVAGVSELFSTVHIERVK